MRTTSLLVLGLVLVSAYVSSAPVEKPLEVAKRDQEMILFGNQQNDPRMKKKKSDPAVEAGDSLVDQHGYIEAVPANPEHFIPQETESADDNTQKSKLLQEAEAVIPPIKQEVPEETEESSEEVEVAEPEADTDSVEEELKGIMAASNAQEEEPSVEVSEVEEEPVVELGANAEAPQVPVKEVVEEVEEKEVPEESEENKEQEQELEQEEASVEDPTQSQEEAEMTDEIPDNTDFQNILDSLEYYYLKQRPSDNREDYYGLMYPSDYRYKRSIRNTRAVTEGGMSRNNLQRSKRIKRDLFEDEDGLYYDPYGEETYVPEVSEDDLYGLYRVDPKYEDEVETLLDMYEQAPEEASYESYDPYEQLPVEEVYPELYEELQEEQEEEPVYVPSKRQMMSSLPGIKKRYFYPFSREPETHWGAFIPEQKRDYDETYRRLLALASALSDDSPYYQGYKK